MPSLAMSTLNNVTSAGPSITITGNVTYDTLEWDQSYNFSVPSQIGTLA